MQTFGESPEVYDRGLHMHRLHTCIRFKETKESSRKTKNIEEKHMKKFVLHRLQL